ncbi:MAG: leucine-rich repeat domain-containing protein, partial [Oscillospiraceae bacterium]|nr:leucine-rich repeat domain-containing protein [Oscillospiraceae bacterium]
MKRIFAVVTVLAVLLGNAGVSHFKTYAVEYRYEIDGVYYDFVPWGEPLLCVYGYNSEAVGPDVTVASEIDGYPVTDIGWSAFDGCERLENITLPNSVKYINDGAFLNCRNLKYAELGAGVQKIGSIAFEFCESLQGVNIPDGVTEIGSYAFFGCKSLTEISLPENVAVLFEAVFADCENLAAVNMPGVRQIGRWA